MHEWWLPGGVERSVIIIAAGGQDHWWWCGLDYFQHGLDHGMVQSSWATFLLFDYVSPFGHNHLINERGEISFPLTKTFSFPL